MVKTSDELVLVSFKLGNELFGIDIHQAREVIHLCEIINVPHSPSLVEGIISLRGSVVCVLDLGRRLEKTHRNIKPSSRIIIVDIGARSLGLIVDEVREVVRLQPEQLEPIPPEMDTIDTRFLRAVGKVNGQFMLILDVDKMLSPEELLRIDSAT